MSRSRLRGWLFPALRVVVSVLLLMWLLHRLQGVREELGQVEPLTLWPAAAIYVLSTLLGAVQWSWILHHAQVGVPTGRLHRLYWIGLFFNNFLPSNVGGDLVKVADVAVTTGRVVRPLAATILDRMLGLLALVTLALLAGAVLGGRSPAGLPWWTLVLVTLPVLLLCAGLLSRRLGRLVVRLLRGVRLGGPGRRLASLAEEMQAYRVAPAFLVRIGLLALVVQSLRVLTHVAVARAMGLPLGGERLLEFFVLIPVLGVAIVLPVSFNGLGLRELVASRLMPQVGIGAQEAVALQLSTYLVQVAVSLVGGLLFVWQLARGKPASGGGTPGAGGV